MASIAGPAPRGDHAAALKKLDVTGRHAQAVRVGRVATAPALLVDTSTALSATGVKVTAAAAAGGVAIAAISSGTNENVTIDAKGSGTIGLGSVSTGNIVLGRATSCTSSVTARSATATAAAASAVAAFAMGSAGVGIYWGTGTPDSVVTAAKGSLYIRTDGSGTSTRLYVNTDAATAWTNVTTAG